MCVCVCVCVYLLSLSERWLSLMNCSMSCCWFLSSNSSSCNTLVNRSQYLFCYLLLIRNITAISCSSHESIIP